MGTLAESVTAHLQKQAAAAAAALSPEERKAARKAFCRRFESLRGDTILPAFGEACDALQAQGYRANVMLDRSEAWRGLGALPTVLETDRRASDAGLIGQPYECRMVWRVEDGDHLLVRVECEGIDLGSGIGRDFSCHSLEELTPGVVAARVLAFVQLATGSR